MNRQERIEEIENDSKLKANKDFYHSDCVDLDDYVELADRALVLIKELEEENREMRELLKETKVVIDLIK